jgi:hypothetical protein
MSLSNPLNILPHCFPAVSERKAPVFQGLPVINFYLLKRREWDHSICQLTNSIFLYTGMTIRMIIPNTFFRRYSAHDHAEEVRTNE